MSRQLQVSDVAVINYGGTEFTTKIISITGNVITLQDVNNGIITSLTWNGFKWLLPGNIEPQNVKFYYSEVQNSLSTISSSAAPVVSLQTTAQQPQQPARAFVLKLIN